jgi:hypothetical protein
MRGPKTLSKAIVYFANPSQTLVEVCYERT